MAENHGGGKFAKSTGSNRKADKRYDMRAVDFAKMKSNEGYTKPGSRKKVGG